MLYVRFKYFKFVLSCIILDLGRLFQRYEEKHNRTTDTTGEKLQIIMRIDDKKKTNFSLVYYSTVDTVKWVPIL